MNLCDILNLLTDAEVLARRHHGGPSLIVDIRCARDNAMRGNWRMFKDFMVDVHSQFCFIRGKS